MYQTHAYSATVQPSDEKSTLQKEVEDNEDIDCLMKTLLKHAILTCLKMAVGDCAKHECHGCKMNHPSQKYHDICLWTSPREWIEDYGCHDPALEGLNIYDVMKDFDDRISNYLYGDSLRHPMDFTTGINHLTPEENQEAYKNWQYFKKNSLDYYTHHIAPHTIPPKMTKLSSKLNLTKLFYISPQQNLYPPQR